MVKIFATDAGIQDMEDQINEWIELGLGEITGTSVAVVKETIDIGYPLSKNKTEHTVIVTYKKSKEWNI